MLYPQNPACDCHDSCQCLSATSDCYLHHTVSAEAESFLQLSGVQGLPAFCYTVSAAATHPFHAFLLTSCVGPDSSFLWWKALALSHAFTRAHGQQDSYAHSWVVPLSLYLCSNREVIQMIAVESLQTEEVSSLRAKRKLLETTWAENVTDSRKICITGLLFKLVLHWCCVNRLISLMTDVLWLKCLWPVIFTDSCDFS